MRTKVLPNISFEIITGKGIGRREGDAGAHPAGPIPLKVPHLVMVCKFLNYGRKSHLLPLLSGQRLIENQ